MPTDVMVWLVGVEVFNFPTSPSPYLVLWGVIIRW